MKKCFKIFLLFLVLFLPYIKVDASTNTYVRTYENWLVPNDIVVDSSNMSSVLSTPAVNAEEKIYDFASLLTSQEEVILYDEVIQFIEKSNLDLAIVTVSDYDKICSYEDCSQVYADDFYDYNSFGLGDDYSGLLFLVDMKNREIYISTTGKAMDMYNDIRIDKILDAIYTEFGSDKYFEGITKFMTIIENYDTMGLPSNIDSKYAISADGEIYRKFPWLIVLGVPSVITIIVMGILISKNKMVKVATTSREYLEKGSINIKVVRDVLTSSHTTSTPISHSSSSGGGSSHSGSSGRSHGGGGHHF